METCAYGDCEKPAIVTVVWGDYQTADYCYGCAKALHICLECGTQRLDDERVGVGMKCGRCAYGL